MAEFLRIGEILAEKGISGKDLAEMIGSHPVYVSEIVNHRKVPRKDMLLKIATALDVDVRELLVSTKATDLSDPKEALKEIRRIVDRADLD